MAPTWRPRAGRPALGDEALGRRDVDVHGDRGTVALNDDGNGPCSLRTAAAMSSKLDTLVSPT